MPYYFLLSFSLIIRFAKDLAKSTNWVKTDKNDRAIRNVRAGITWILDKVATPEEVEQLAKPAPEPTDPHRSDWNDNRNNVSRILQERVLTTLDEIEHAQLSKLYANSNLPFPARGAKSNKMGAVADRIARIVNGTVGVAAFEIAYKAAHNGQPPP